MQAHAGMIRTAHSHGKQQSGQNRGADHSTGQGGRCQERDEQTRVLEQVAGHVMQDLVGIAQKSTAYGMRAGKADSHRLRPVQPRLSEQRGVLGCPAQGVVLGKGHPSAFAA